MTAVGDSNVTCIKLAPRVFVLTAEIYIKDRTLALVAEEGRATLDGDESVALMSVCSCALLVVHNLELRNANGRASVSEALEPLPRNEKRPTLLPCLSHTVLPAVWCHLQCRRDEDVRLHPQGQHGHECACCSRQPVSRQEPVFHAPRVLSCVAVIEAAELTLGALCRAIRLGVVVPFETGARWKCTHVASWTTALLWCAAAKLGHACLLTQNEYSLIALAQYGGAISNDAGTMLLHECIFTNNGETSDMGKQYSGVITSERP